VDIYLELGTKRVFAVAVDWPGWARSGRDEKSAVAELLDYGERYRSALGKAADGLVVPASADRMPVIERLEGNATTDFGAPGVIPALDRRATDTDDLRRLTDLLQAAWGAFERTAHAPDGAGLAPSGPRGGGRSLDKIRVHVAEADGGYLNALGGKYDPNASWAAVQKMFIEAAGARARGELPETGPRGGKRWPARFAIRRSAWHALDHAWEIEDRREG
jgi:hypothetical protein